MLYMKVAGTVFQDYGNDHVSEGRVGDNIPSDVKVTLKIYLLLNEQLQLDCLSSVQSVLFRSCSNCFDAKNR